ncbi:FAD:protein FMN transferase [Sphingobacterium hungaricum]
MKPLHFLFSFILLIGSVSVGHGQILFKQKATLMGSLFEITVVDSDTLSARKNVQAVISEITRIENLISEWKSDSEVSEVNRSAGIQPVRVSPELFDLTKRAIYYSEISEGAFDISIAAMDKIWLFDGSMTEMPTESAIRKSVEKVGYKNIVLDSIHSTIFLRYPGMKIGFGSIGKGYAADKGRELMKQTGVEGGIVNASGDIATWGLQPDKNPWTIGINNPFKPHKLIEVLKLKESAVATSGSYEKYAEIDGKKYAHIINPKTGYPSTGLTSVTIVGPSAEFANALSTSSMVLGKKAALKLVKKFPSYRGVFLTDKGRVHKAN